MSRRYGLIFLLLLTFFSSPASAEPLTPGQRYVGPKTLEVASLSIAFALPAGWAGVLPPGTEWFHVGKDEEVGRVFMWATRASEADVRTTMSQPFPAGNAVQLSPTGQVRVESGALVAEYDATDGVTQYKAHARTVVRGGVAVAIIAVAPAEKLDSYKALAAGIEKSLKFAVKPKPSPNAGTGAGPWVAALSNHRVVKYSGSNGYREKTEFHICGNGRFYQNFDAMSSSQLGNGAMADNNGGTWSISGNQLSLQWADGNVSKHVLEDRGGKLFVDGTRWLREPYACQ